jgi:hypothetical protein
LVNQTMSKGIKVPKEEKENTYLTKEKEKKKK